MRIKEDGLLRRLFLKLYSFRLLVSLAGRSLDFLFTVHSHAHSQTYTDTDGTTEKREHRNIKKKEKVIQTDSKRKSSEGNEHETGREGYVVLELNERSVDRPIKTAENCQPRSGLVEGV